MNYVVVGSNTVAVTYMICLIICFFEFSRSMHFFRGESLTDYI